MEINPNPYPVEAHAVNVGVLVTQLQVLEFAARVAIGKTRPQFSIGYLQGIQPGDVVTEDPLNDYDQLSAILMRLNKLAPADRQLDVQALVDLRDQLAHGRVTAFKPEFPLTLLKFGKPKEGQVTLLARIEMTEAWFSEQRRLVDGAMRVVEHVQFHGGTWSQ